MADNKKELDCFPIWKPQKSTRYKFRSNDFRVRYNALRYSSDTFIKNKDVRRIVKEKSFGKCVECSSKEQLQIDHINSVYSVARNQYPIVMLNSIDNLQVLCLKCNSAKLP